MYQRFVCFHKRHLNNTYDIKICYVAMLQRQNCCLVLFSVVILVRVLMIQCR